MLCFVHDFNAPWKWEIFRGVNLPEGELSRGWNVRGVKRPGEKRPGVKPSEEWIIRWGETFFYKGVNCRGVNHKRGEISGIPKIKWISYKIIKHKYIWKNINNSLRSPKKLLRIGKMIMISTRNRRKIYMWKKIK